MDVKYDKEAECLLGNGVDGGKDSVSVLFWFEGVGVSGRGCALIRAAITLERTLK